MIHRHEVCKGERVWAWIKGEPTEIVFLHLLPYSGFAFNLTTDTPETFALPAFKDMEIGKTYDLVSHREEQSEAVFAKTREDLIRDRIRKLRSNIEKLDLQISDLVEMLNYPRTEQPAAERSAE